jgi:uncharacterized protein YutE (UPF0331/DUF86 family)
MTQLDPISLTNKVERMIARIDQLRKFRDYTLEQYLIDENYTQTIVERLLELVIQSALDINRALLKQISGITVVKNADTFIEVSKAGYIPVELGQNSRVRVAFAMY